MLVMLGRVPPKGLIYSTVQYEYSIYLTTRLDYSRLQHIT